MHLRSWRFRVQVDTRPGEVVGLTGDVPQLGEWKVASNNTVVLLSKESSDSDGNMWAVTTWIPLGSDVHYRYYTCIVVDDKYMITRREVNIMPRVIQKDVPSNSEELPRAAWDVFGSPGGTPPFVDRGWLTSETVIQINLHTKPVHFWKEKLQRRRLLVKLTPVSLRTRSVSLADGPELGELMENSLSLDTQENGGESPDGWPITEVADLSEDQPELLRQEQFGRELKPESFLLFQVQTLKPDEVTYLVDLYMPKPGSDIPEHIGFAYILPSVMKGSSTGRLVVPITSTRHRPIGQLTVYFVVILPIPEAVCDMSASYSKYWKHSSLGLDVGHRGLGTSFKQKSCAEVRENTIASLKEAASHGADFVEFDVQLSKDLVPVIYHDFFVCISLKRKRANDGDMLEFPLKELTLHQLHSLKLYHIQEGKEKQQLLFDDELEEHQPFPTLEHVFQVIDPLVGFNIEIKWTMELKDGTMELYNPFDLNLYLDSVLKVVLKHGSTRKVVFSCFHPDICTMVKYKQSKYPVVFLTQGVTSKYPMYQDPRCHTIPSAVRFAYGLGMLGINVHTEDILRDPEQVRLVKSNGLVVFCWGDDNNDPETISYLKKLGLNAIIYDKIDQFGPKSKQQNTVFMPEDKQSQKEWLQVAEAVGVSGDIASGAPGASAVVPSPNPTSPTSLLASALQPIQPTPVSGVPGTSSTQRPST